MDLFDPSAPKPFTITVSARALFDLEEEHKIFTDRGEKAFAQHQMSHELNDLRPGTAFSLVRKLLDLNSSLPEGARHFEVVLLSRNSPETGVRVFRTIEHMNLPIYRAIFTRGSSPSRYIKALGADLFLSSNTDEVRKVLAMGVAAAALVPHAFENLPEDGKIRVAFDGDAVLFSDEAELIHAEGGLEAFQEHERRMENTPLPEGPMRAFLEAINTIQQSFPSDSCPLRTALVTARSMPAHNRAINTLRSWGVRMDEGLFLGGRDKGPFLEAFGADLFLDDSRRNIESAVAHNVRSGHVPYGARNAIGADDSAFSGGAGPVPPPHPSLEGKEKSSAAHTPAVKSPPPVPGAELVASLPRKRRGP